jgi:hypothetical protein
MHPGKEDDDSKTMKPPTPHIPSNSKLWATAMAWRLHALLEVDRALL